MPFVLSFVLSLICLTNFTFWFRGKDCPSPTVCVCNFILFTSVHIAIRVFYLVKGRRTWNINLCGVCDVLIVWNCPLSSCWLLYLFIGFNTTLTLRWLCILRCCSRLFLRLQISLFVWRKFFFTLSVYRNLLFCWHFWFIHCDKRMWMPSYLCWCVLFRLVYVEILHFCSLKKLRGSFSRSLLLALLHFTKF